MIKKIFKIFIKLSSKSYTKYLKNKGCKIGEGTILFFPHTVNIDETRPWLVEIGKNVQITKNFTLLTHGYDWSVLKGKYGEILGSSGKVKIGDNVFIGFNVTITKGVTIGNNVIIGANSLVTHDIPDNCVYGGIPAKHICSIDEYYEKRKKAQLSEAVELVNSYIKTYNKIPEKKILREFYWLFETRENFDKNNDLKNIMNLIGNYEKTKEIFLKTKPSFNSYEEFIKYCISKEG